MRDVWQSSPMPAVVVPARVEVDLGDVAYTRYALLDRGSYDFADVSTLDALDALADIAREVTGRSLAVAAARVVRLLPGDYLLTRHDRVHDESPLELVLDLSAAPVEGAEVHWRHRGQVYFTMPTVPGTLAIVERGPTVMSNHTYVSKRWGEVSVVRLIVLLRRE